VFLSLIWFCIDDSLERFDCLKGLSFQGGGIGSLRIVNDYFFNAEMANPRG